jgi:hypothetical protein
LVDPVDFPATIYTKSEISLVHYDVYNKKRIFDVSGLPFGSPYSEYTGYDFFLSTGIKNVFSEVGICASDYS